MTRSLETHTPQTGVAPSTVVADAAVKVVECSFLVPMGLKHMISKTAIAALACSLVGGTASAATITFDDLGLSPTVPVVVGVSPLNVGSGFTLQMTSVPAGAQALIIDADDTGEQAHSGQNSTEFLLFAKELGSQPSLLLKRADDSAFSLSSFSYHGWNNNYSPQLVVQGFGPTGVLNGTIFQITNYNNGPFHLATLSDPFWSNLTAVRFTVPQGVFSLDNINVGTVSVPGPIVGAGLPGLMLAGLGILGWRRRVHGNGRAISQALS
jgi:hypothetical protein